MERVANKTKPIHLGAQYKTYHDQLNLTQGNIPNQYHLHEERVNHT